MKFTDTDSAQLDLTMEVPYITFPVLSELPFIKHGFSTKLGGVSCGMYESLNFGEIYEQGKDSPYNILENYNRMAKSLAVDVQSMVISQQVHKTNIRVVTKQDCGKGLFTPRDYEEIDGLITNTPGITLVTKYADCVPLYFVDPVNKAIGLTHSGWRGTVAKIGKITAEEMKKNFGSNPDHLLAVIGPSICRECYEIGEEVAAEFQKAFQENSAEILNRIITPKGNGKYLCDLWAANQAVLSEAGIKPEHIHTSGVCTCCHDDLLFSHRKTQGKRGSLAAFLALA